METSNKKTLFQVLKVSITGLFTVLLQERMSSFSLDCCQSRVSVVIVIAECFYGNGRGYRGNISRTSSNKTCLSWDTPRPDKNIVNEIIYDEIRNSSNFCRNPGGLSFNKPWCYYLNDRGTVNKEHCDVPECPKQRKYTDFLRGFHLATAR